MKILDAIYFDHQATTPVAKQVLHEMLPYFRESFANPHSSDHALGWKSSHAVENAAQKVANLIGANADEIVFTSGATESNNMALLGLANHAINKANNRNKIIVSSIEHKCILTVGRVLKEQFGFQVEFLPVGKTGHISLSDLESMLGDDVLAVSIMVVNNEIGTIQDIARISEIIQPSGAIFHCDAAQAPVAMNMQNFAQNIDLLSLSGHKMYGPKGIGSLYIRRNLQNEIEPLIYGGGQQDGLRSGTVPTPLCVGMGAAADFLCTKNKNVENMRTQLQKRCNLFIEKLSRLPWSITMNGPSQKYRHPGNANIRFKGFVAQDILSVLQPRLAASTGSACTSGITEPSHVLKAIGLTSDEAEASVRFSLGFDTSDKDVDEAVNLINNALHRLSDVPSLHSA